MAIAGDEFDRRQAVHRGVRSDDVWAAEPVVRRVIAARVRDPAVVDDLVQDALERLLRARKRVAEELLVPFAVVTARNLVVSHLRRARSARRAEQAPAEVGSPLSPDDVVVHEEERLALASALRRLPESERAQLVARDIEGVPVAELAEEGVSQTAMRARLTRSRAKLRVEYALLRTGLELPTDRCRPTLLRLAGSDTSRRDSPEASRHLMRCPACSALSEELVQRRGGVIILLPLVGLRWAAHAARTHPLTAAAGTATAAAVAAGAVAVASGGAPPRPAVPVSTTVTIAPPPTLPPPLAIDGRPFLPVGDGSLESLVGQLVTARAVVVQSAVTHDGFWIGTSPAQRLWVELTGPLRSVQVSPGEHVSFAAPLVAQPPTYAEQVGLPAEGGAAQLDAQGAHVDLPTTALTVTP